MEVWVINFLDLLVTAVAYLFVPIIFCIRGNELSKSKIKKIVIINGICVFLIFAIIKILAEVDQTSYAWVLWSGVAYWLMEKQCVVKNARFSESSEEKYIPKYTTTPVRVEEISLTNKPEEHKKTTKTVSIVLVVLLAISIIINVCLFVYYVTYKEISNELVERKTNNESAAQTVRTETKIEYSVPEDYYEISEKVDFYDNNIVFVIEGYGNYYYTYDEMVYATRNEEEYSYWAYNKEQAISKGYKAYGDNN